MSTVKHFPVMKVENGIFMYEIPPGTVISERDGIKGWLSWGKDQHNYLHQQVQAGYILMDAPLKWNRDERPVYLYSKMDLTPIPEKNEWGDVAP